MKVKYANNPGKLAEWAAATHIERAPRRSNQSRRTLREVQPRRRRIRRRVKPAKRVISVAPNIRRNDSAAACFAGFDRLS